MTTMKRCPICARSYPAVERFCSVHGLPLVGDIDSTAATKGELSGIVVDNRYCLGGVAGRGGMGVVYEAEHLRIGRRCAVKVLHKELHADPKMRMRLFREVQATSRVRHPNVVEIMDFGDDETAGSYLVMEFLEGESLGQIIRRKGTLELDWICKVMVQLTAALAATHSRGLIHRDLKPSNIRILLTGLVKVLDFGLVKPYDDGTAQDFVTITTGGMAFGTPWYMSPEQATFKTLDPRTDIYSLGIVLYEMLTGQLPFKGDNPLDLIEAHRNQPVPLPSSLTPPIEIPTEMEMLLLKTLNKDPDMRYQSMSDLMDGFYLVGRAANLNLDYIQSPTLADHPPPIPADDEDEEQRDTDWTLPIVPSTMPLSNLRDLVMERLDEIVERIVNALRAAIPRYRTIKPKVLAENVRLSLKTAITVFDDKPLAELPVDFRKLADQRKGQEFTPTEIIGAMWMELSMLRPLLKEVAGDKIESLAYNEEQLDHRILSFVLKLVDYYFSSYHGRLVRLNEALSTQNEELIKLRSALTNEVKLTTHQLAEAEVLKSQVVENISSGLVLVDHDTQDVRIFNKAMERMSGMAARQALGQPIDQVLSFTDGVPLDEFREQIRLHGQVGLRKLWIRFHTTGTQKAVYIRGQAFYDGRNNITGSLFVVDDVTEREQIIESFSRYLSREVVQRVLHQPNLLKPDGKKRHAVMMAINVTDFNATLKGMSPEDVVELLTDYVRAVGDAVFKHGGVVDAVVGDGILVYFDADKEDILLPVKAAVNCLNRLESLNLQRKVDKKVAISAAIGLHAGEVLVVNVGGKHRMVHTVVGEVASIAKALQGVASSGEILISSEMARRMGGKFPLENGPVVSVDGLAKPVEAFRVSYEIEPLDDPTII